MDITGERFEPELDGNWTLEHTHRYMLACELAAGKSVLDIACGEGYGAHMLSCVAKSVVAVDISFETLARAVKKYRRPGLSFFQGNAAAIPLVDNAVDLVSSFETIEHLAEQEDMIREIRRVLRPEGLLIISTPDKYEYSDLTGYQNAYHVKELYRNEFEALLKKEFRCVQVAGQRIVFGSVVGTEGVTQFLSWRKNEPESRTPGLSSAEYLIAVAGDEEVPLPPSGILKAPQDESDAMRSLAKELYSAKDEITRAGATIGKLEGHLLGLLEQRDRLLAELAGVYASKSWRVTAPLRRIADFFRRARDSRGRMSVSDPCAALPVWDAEAVRKAVWPPDVRALQKPLSLNTDSLSSVPRIGVFLHVYYSELIGEMVACLRNLPDAADIFISTDGEEKRAALADSLAANGFADRATIRVLPNIGWDIAPFLIGFSDVIPRYPLILRLHSKRSTFIPGNIGDTWRGMLFNSLAGNKDRVNGILRAFAEDASLGLICPPSIMHYADSVTMGGNFAMMRDLLAPHGVILERDTPVDFPMGSMFWCRPDVLAPWLNRFSFDDFGPTEEDSRDGTLAHAVERLFFFGCGITGYTWARVESCSHGA